MEQPWRLTCGHDYAIRLDDQGKPVIEDVLPDGSPHLVRNRFGSIAKKDLNVSIYELKKERFMSQKLFKTIVLSIIVSAVLTATQARAECFGPVCHAMHSMQDDLDCLSGQGFQCDPDDATIADLKQSWPMLRRAFKPRIRLIQVSSTI